MKFLLIYNVFVIAVEGLTHHNIFIDLNLTDCKFLK
jgi:hypothetical protein